MSLKRIQSFAKRKHSKFKSLTKNSANKDTKNQIKKNRRNGTVSLRSMNIIKSQQSFDHLSKDHLTNNLFFSKFTNIPEINLSKEEISTSNELFDFIMSYFQLQDENILNEFSDPQLFFQKVDQENEMLYNEFNSLDDDFNYHQNNKHQIVLHKDKLMDYILINEESPNEQYIDEEIKKAERELMQLKTKNDHIDTFFNSFKDIFIKKNKKKSLSIVQPLTEQGIIYQNPIEFDIVSYDSEYQLKKFLKITNEDKSEFVENSRIIEKIFNQNMRIKEIISSLDSSPKTNKLKAKDFNLICQNYLKNPISSEIFTQIKNKKKLINEFITNFRRKPKLIKQMTKQNIFSEEIYKLNQESKSLKRKNIFFVRKNITKTDLSPKNNQFFSNPENHIIKYNSPSSTRKFQRSRNKPILNVMPSLNKNSKKQIFLKKEMFNNKKLMRESKKIKIIKGLHSRMQYLQLNLSHKKKGKNNSKQAKSSKSISEEENHSEKNLFNNSIILNSCNSIKAIPSDQMINQMFRNPSETLLTNAKTNSNQSELLPTIYSKKVFSLERNFTTDLNKFKKMLKSGSKLF